MYKLIAKLKQNYIEEVGKTPNYLFIGPNFINAFIEQSYTETLKRTERMIELGAAVSELTLTPPLNESKIIGSILMGMEVVKINLGKTFVAYISEKAITGGEK